MATVNARIVISGDENISFGCDDDVEKTKQMVKTIHEAVASHVIHSMECFFQDGSNSMGVPFLE